MSKELNNMQDLKNIEKEFSKSFMYSIHQVYFLASKHIEKILNKEKKLTFSQFMIIASFEDCGTTKHESQSLIAKCLHITEATVSKHTKKLEELEFLSKVEDKNNRRKYIIKVTEKGKKEFKKTKMIIQKELDQIFSIIDKKDREDIIKNFTKILDTLLTKIN